VPGAYLEQCGPAEMELCNGQIVTVLPIRANASKALTVEEILGQKKSMHVNAFRFLIGEMSRDLRRIAATGGAEARQTSDATRVFSGKQYTVELLVERSVDLVKEVLWRHEELAPESYTDDGVYRRLMQEMMDARAMAESLLRLYLEDHSRGIWWRTTRTSLREAHRELIAHRARKMAILDGEGRRAAAEQLCVLRGYAAERVSETNEAGEDPLVCAAADGAVGAAGVALLLAAGATTDEEALVAAALYGQREAVEALLDAGINVDSRAKKSGRTGLIQAANTGQIHAVRLLLKRCAGVNAASSDVTTSLIMAAQNGHKAVVRLLIKHKAEINAANKDGVTGPYLAARDGHEAVVRLLIGHKADVNVARKDGRTGLFQASDSGHEAVVRLLIEHKAEVDAANKHGSTGLCKASQNGHLEVVQLLLDSRADINKAGGVRLRRCASPLTCSRSRITRTRRSAQKPLARTHKHAHAHPESPQAESPA